MTGLELQQKRIAYGLSQQYMANLLKMTKTDYILLENSTIEIDKERSDTIENELESLRSLDPKRLNKISITDIPKSKRKKQKLLQEKPPLSIEEKEEVLKLIKMVALLPEKKQEPIFFTGTIMKMGNEAETWANWVENMIINEPDEVESMIEIVLKHIPKKRDALIHLANKLDKLIRFVQQRQNLKQNKFFELIEGKLTDLSEAETEIALSKFDNIVAKIKQNRQF